MRASLPPNRSVSESVHTGIGFRVDATAAHTGNNVVKVYTASGNRLRVMANKPKAEPGYPRHDGEDPTFPNKAKLDIISGQEKPELIDLHSDDDDPDFDDLDLKPKPPQNAKKTPHPGKVKKPEAKDNTQRK